jgi:peroxiredoxin Q/BCP
MISSGQKIYLGFRVKVVRGGLVKELTFAELLTRPTIVSVYMKNNTPSCDRQNSSLAAHAAEFHHAGFNLIAVSRNTCGSHIRYAQARDISYTLVSDPEDKFASAADSLLNSLHAQTRCKQVRLSARALPCDGIEFQ